MDSTFTNQESVGTPQNYIDQRKQITKIKEEKDEIDVDALFATINDLADEMDKTNNSDELRGTTSVPAKTNNDIDQGKQMTKIKEDEDEIDVDALFATINDLADEMDETNNPDELRVATSVPVRQTIRLASENERTSSLRSSYVWLL